MLAVLGRERCLHKHTKFQTGKEDTFNTDYLWRIGLRIPKIGEKIHFSFYPFVPFEFLPQRCISFIVKTKNNKFKYMTI